MVSRAGNDAQLEHLTGTVTQFPSCGQDSDSGPVDGDASLVADRKLMRRVWVISGAVLATLLLLVLFNFQHRLTATSKVVPLENHTPPIEYYIAHAKDHTRIGDVATATLELPCASTKTLLTQINRSAESGDTREAAALLLGTHSTVLNVGDKYQVLDLDLNQAKIRILRTGNECWLPSLAMR